MTEAPMLSRSEADQVRAILAGTLDIEGNEWFVRKVLDRMLTELDAWHRLAWLHSDMKIAGVL